MRKMTATEARKMWFSLVEQAGKPGSIITIKHRDLPDVVLMSLDEFEGWQETLEILSDPQLVKDIREGIHETETIPWEEVKEELDL